MSRRRKRKQHDGHSAVFCNHANEVPMSCPCDEACYCKLHACRRDSLPDSDEIGWRRTWGLQ